MNGQHLTMAALRILAVWIAATTLMNLPAFLISWFWPSAGPFGPDEAAAAWRFGVVQFGSAALIALGLWQSSGWLSMRIRPGGADDVAPPLNAIELQRVALAAVGVILVTNGLPELAQLVVAGLQLPDGFVQSDEMLSTRSAQLIGVGIQVAVGLGLVFGASALTRLIRGLRDVGAKDEAREA